MRRSQWIMAAGSFFVAISVCLASISTPRSRIVAQNAAGELVQLVVQDKKLELIRPDKPPDIYEADKDAPHRWYIDGTRIKSSVDGQYLVYDPTGKNLDLSLSPKPVQGVEWRFERLRIQRRIIAGSVDHQWGCLIVAKGPCEGWLVDVEESEEQRGHGVTAKVRRLVLSKTSRWYVQAARIYRAE